MDQSTPKYIDVNICVENRRSVLYKTNVLESRQRKVLALEAGELFFCSYESESYNEDRALGHLLDSSWSQDVQRNHESKLISKESNMRKD